MTIKILLDPGHYKGYNTAAYGYSEGTRMWTLYTYLRPMLEAYGFKVGVTKSSASDYPKTQNGEDNITGRGRKAKGYNLMLSLHTNACGTQGVNRPVVIYPISGKCKNLASNLGASLQKCMGLQQYQIMSKKSNSSNADYYGVIRGAASVGVPCLIVEHTFHTNNNMAKWLMSDVNLKKVAKCVADTVAQYYGYKIKEDEIDMTKDEVKKLVKETVNEILEGENTTVSNWAKDEMDKAIKAGITDGSRPGGYAKRQEVIAMLVRALNK